MMKLEGQGFIPFLSVIPLHAETPVKSTYPEELKTIGDHIRKVRFERGLLQKEVADIIGVNVATIVNWEKNHTSPPVMTLPKIIDFLGYNPPMKEVVDDSLGCRLKAYRIKHGLSIRNLAKLIPCDENTISRMEKGEGWFYKETVDKIIDLLNLNVSISYIYVC